MIPPSTERSSDEFVRKRFFSETLTIGDIRHAVHRRREINAVPMQCGRLINAIVYCYSNLVTFTNTDRRTRKLTVDEISVELTALSGAGDAFPFVTLSIKILPEPFHGTMACGYSCCLGHTISEPAAKCRKTQRFVFYKNDTPVEKSAERNTCDFVYDTYGVTALRAPTGFFQRVLSIKKAKQNRAFPMSLLRRKSLTNQ